MLMISFAFQTKCIIIESRKKENNNGEEYIFNLKDSKHYP